MEPLIIRVATAADLDPLKALADRHKREVGFVRRGALLESIRRAHLLVALVGEDLVGFVQFHHRRDGQTTIHLIMVATAYRRQGVADVLLNQLRATCRELGQQRIGLKCPVELSANDFYRQAGFDLIAQEPGKLRPLNLWQLLL